MYKLVLTAALVAGAVATASTAQAFPVSSKLQDADNGVIQVRDGCGVGWHRGPYGVCHPNGARYVYRPYVAYAPPPYPARCWWVETAYGPGRVCAW